MRTENFDVVVVGFGNAAQAAAYSARQTGAKTLIIEKAPEKKRGGNTRFSASAHLRHVHNGLPEEIALLPHIPKSEFDRVDLEPYSKDDFYADLMRVTRGRSVPELAELLVSESYPTVKWMREAGIVWEIFYEGGIPQGDRLRWHHGHAFTHSKEGGDGLVRMWEKILRDSGVEIRFGTGAVRLLTDDRAAVTGLVCQDKDGMYQVRAKGVVLACGGFEANPAMRAQYLGAGWDLSKVRGTKFNTGDGIQMALDIGAQAFGHWGGSHATPIDSNAGEYEGAFLDPVNYKNRTHRYAWTLGIMVNVEGRRFIDEGEDFSTYTYAKTGAEIFKQPGGVAYQIFDAKQKSELTRQQYDAANPAKANTIRELAEQLEINPDVLQETVDTYNAAVQDHLPFNQAIHDGRCTKDLFPPKTNWARRIDEPPFVAYGATCGLTFTYGGLKIDTRCQVQNKLDLPIKGLYAAGELTGGFFYFNYPSGSGLMRGAVTGKISGANAAGA